MANALDAAMFSVEKGNTGVGSKKTTLEAIDKGALDVKSWKDGIDAERLKLKTDTADKYREAEKLAQEKIGAMQPNNKTERDLVIKGLASYKDQLYNNMQLVKNGVIKPDENTIFQSNGKQTFDIISQQIASQAEQTNLSLERAKGGYWPDEEGGPDIFHKPVAGAIEAKLQEIQNAVSNPQFTNINFGRDGMGEVEFYKTKLNPATNTMELDLDANGEPQRNENFSLSILALDKNANQRADVFYLNEEVNELLKGPLGNTFETMRTTANGKMYSSILDYQMENPLVEESIIDASAVAVATAERVASILTDNGTQAERSIPTTPSEWASLTDEQKSETVSYEYTDSKGKRHTDGIKFKYMEMQVSSNNTIVPVFRKGVKGVRGDEEVARDMATSSIIAAIERDYTDKGIKRSEFDPNSSGAYNNKVINDDKIGRVELAKRLASGGNSQTSALAEMKASGLYTVEKGFNEILDSTPVQELPDELDNNGQPRKGEIYRVQTPRGIEKRIVYHTGLDGSTIPLEDRTQQTLGLIMTNPTETKDLFKTYISGGNNFTETYDVNNFQGNQVSTGTVTVMAMDTVVEGTGTNAITLGNRITDVIETADDASDFGVDEDLLVSGLKGAINEALNKSNQEFKNLNVTHDGDDNITITGVNSKGKTITITGAQKSDNKDEMQVEVDALLNQFFQNMASDEDINLGATPNVG